MRNRESLSEIPFDWSLLARKFTRLREECYEDDDYKTAYYRNMVNFNVIKGYYWAKKSVDKIERYNMCIKIPAGSEKCVKLLIIDIMDEVS